MPFKERTQTAEPNLRALMRRESPSRIQERHLRMMDARIKECRTMTDSNCVGTAFYIMGENASHEYVTAAEASFRISELKRLPVPIRGCLVAWEARLDPEFHPEMIKKIGSNLFIAHAGVVSSTVPLLVANRISDKGLFFATQPFEHVGMNYPYCSASFYLPTALQNKELESWLGCV